MLIKTVLCSLILTNTALSFPANDKALFDTNDPEARIHKRRRPCRGRTPDGRTFFDWNLQYIDVHYNYNYNVNCGGGGGSHGGGGISNKPILSGILQGGGDHGGGQADRPQKPILSGLVQGGNWLAGDEQGNGLFGSNGPISLVQSQVQNILANPPDLSSVLPQDGIFNGGGLGSLIQSTGQGLLSLFDGGLFNGIFDNSNSPVNSPTRPPSVPNQVPSRPPIVTTPGPATTTQDPDDIIYNDEKPVHEDHDPIFPDNYNRPGQYLVASNPHFGQFVYQAGNGFNRRGVRQFNREINQLAGAYLGLFGL